MRMTGRFNDTISSLLYKISDLHRGVVAALWDVMRYRLVAGLGLFRETYRSHIQRSSSPRPIGRPETSVISYQPTSRNNFPLMLCSADPSGLPGMVLRKRPPQNIQRSWA